MYTPINIYALVFGFFIKCTENKLMARIILWFNGPYA